MSGDRGKARGGGDGEGGGRGERMMGIGGPGGRMGRV